MTFLTKQKLRCTGLSVAAFLLAGIQVAHAFAPPSYTLSYFAEAHGSLAGSTSQTVLSGGNGTEVTAIPDAGYTFGGWSDGVTTTARTDTSVLANLNVTSTFLADPPHVTLTPINPINDTLTVQDPMGFVISWDKTINETPLPSALDTSTIAVTGGTLNCEGVISYGDGYALYVTPALPEGATSVEVTVTIPTGFVHDSIASHPSPTSTYTMTYRPVPTEVWVSNMYSSSSADGHDWAYDAFDELQSGINMVASAGTVNVAAGTYSSSSPYIISKTLSLIGPGTEGGGLTSATINNYSCGYALRIDGTENVRVSGFIIEALSDGYCRSNPVVRVGSSASTTFDGNDIAGGSVGVAMRFDSTTGTFQNNAIHDNDWGVVMLNSGAHVFTGNTIRDNGRGLAIGCGPDRCETVDISGMTISENNFYNNSIVGIAYEAGDQMSRVSIGPNNTITANSEGITIAGNAGNLKIFHNSIHDNTMPTSGLHIDGDNAGLMDAAENWWGDASGPTISTNPAGTGEVLTNLSSSNIVYFRPYCLNESCTATSTLSTDPSSLTGLFTVGSFSIPDGEDTASTTQVNVVEDLTISIGAGSGTSTVHLPAGTVITRTDGSNVDGTALTASDISEGSLSGFGGSTVVEGALQWGIPSLGLSFSSPITLNIFVGTELNGQTLTVQRSLSTSSGWTTDGIVSPGTCVVASGMCTFQTTKASYFASTKTTSSGGGGGGGSSGGGGGGGAYILPTFTGPIGGVNVIINAGETETTSPAVTLHLKGGSNAIRMAISNTADFNAVSQETYATTRTWMLSTGYGPKTVYVKFYDIYGAAAQANTGVSLVEKRTPTNTSPPSTDTKSTTGTTAVIPMLYADGSLLRSPNGTVYLVVGKKLQRLTAAQTKKYRGRKTVNVSNDFIQNYGKSIPTYPNGSLLRSPSKRIYLIAAGKKQQIPTLKELQRLHSKKPIIDVSDAVLAQYPTK